MMQRLVIRFWHEGIWVRILVTFVIILLLQISPVARTVQDSLEQAEQLALRGDHAGAALALGNAYRYQPWDADSLAKRAQEEMLAGNEAAAQRDFERLARLRPLKLTEMVTLAATYIRQGKQQESLSVWMRANIQSTLDVKTLANLARDYSKRQLWSEAEATLEGLTLVTPGDAEALYKLGLIEALEQPDWAAITLSKAIAADPRYGPRLAQFQDRLSKRDVLPTSQVYAELGIEYIRLGEYELAETALDRAYDLNPAYGQALAYLAYSRAKLGKPFLGAANQALALEPESPLVNYLAGLCWSEINKVPEARARLEEAYRLDSSNPAFAVEIASTHRADGNYEAAETWMKQAVLLAPDDVRFRVLLAAYYIDENFKLIEEGIPLAETLVQILPEDAEVHAVLGWGYYQVNELDKAEIQLRRALALDPNMARAYTHMGAVMEATGRQAQAIQHYEKAWELDPRGPFGSFARRALDRILGEQ